ncbi:hypothetical protein [Polymorphobacter sp.]|uniref:hypothetical protein n=1 Tax=Polymorphobacter sp. TaxID=1909290 RepID=UPI003F7233DD
MKPPERRAAGRSTRPPARPLVARIIGVSGLGALVTALAVHLAQPLDSGNGLLTLALAAVGVLDLGVAAWLIRKNG